jgi:tRNA-2-methylthio-N6-dimethylallyladenosine synthase
VFGPQTLHRLPRMIDKRRESGRAQVDISVPEIEKFDHLPPARVDGPSAFVSIMEGCSKYCSYCVVPYTRGEEVSRPLRRRADRNRRSRRPGRARSHAARPERQCLSRRPDARLGGIADFATLIEYVADIPGIERIRYTTSHPKEFTQRLIDTYAKVPKLVNHLHLPVQHGSDRILMAMKRGYTVLEYKSVIRKLRAIRPDLSLSTDMIVGFPGETEEDFDKLMTLIDEMKLRHQLLVHLQPAPRHAGREPADDTPHEVKLKRLQALQATSKKTCSASASRWSARSSAFWSSARRAKTRTNCGPHRKQPRGEFPGASGVARAADRPDGRRENRPCVPTFAAWRTRAGA